VLQRQGTSRKVFDWRQQEVPKGTSFFRVEEDGAGERNESVMRNGVKRIA
jgi:hypothetical protein